MLTAIAVLLSLTFIGFLIWWGVRRKPIRAHILMYLLSTLAGVFTLTFFLGMEIPTIIKVVTTIILGAALVFLAAWLQRQKQEGQP